VSTDKPARIVLIEDNPADVWLLRKALDAQDFNYQLDVLEDGEQALRFVREYCHNSGEPLPCVVVLDLHLPRYDGLDVLKRLRYEPSLSDVQVVALTGSTSPGEEAEIMAFGVRLYRQKPDDFDGVLKLGEEIIAVCKEYHQPSV
jgi:CheY-like chemotaxis protein